MTPTTALQTVIERCGLQDRLRDHCGDMVAVCLPRLLELTHKAVGKRISLLSVANVASQSVGIGYVELQWRCYHGNHNSEPVRHFGSYPDEGFSIVSVFVEQIFWEKTIHMNLFIWRTFLIIVVK